jgi:cation diffusion facilitator CzcD-associated flavoprotein CzcO
LGADARVAFVDKMLGQAKTSAPTPEVQSAEWNEANREWTVRGVGHQAIRAKFAEPTWASPSSRPSPRSTGWKTFKGKSYHTGLWPREGVKLAGKRVAVIGTGASGAGVSGSGAPRRE